MSVNPEDMQREIEELRRRLAKLEQEVRLCPPPVEKQTSQDDADNAAYLKHVFGCHPLPIEAFKAGRKSKSEELAPLVNEATNPVTSFPREQLAAVYRLRRSVGLDQ